MKRGNIICLKLYEILIKQQQTYSCTSQSTLPTRAPVQLLGEIFMLATTYDRGSSAMEVFLY